MRSVASLALVVGILAVPSPASADPPVCGPPVVSTTQPGYTVADPDCDVNGTPFVPVGGSSVWTGITDGAAYRIERPAAWNGELVLYAHGFRGSGTTVFVDNPSLRAHYLSRGFAWAASSYQTNGYDVGQGVRDSYTLIRRFKERTGQSARAVYMTGASMGGHVTAVAIEQHPSAFVGAMPTCGVLGDAELFDYFLDANVTAAALTGTAITFPKAPVDPSFLEVYRQQVAQQVPLLGTGAGLTDLGRRWGDYVEQRSGGTRPGFDAAFAYWSALPAIPPLTSVPFLFGVYPGLSGGTANIADGNVTSNRFTLYQGDDNPWLSRDELRLNRDVLRVDRTDRPSRDLSGCPASTGARGCRCCRCTRSATCSCRCRWSRSTPGAPGCRAAGSCSCRVRCGPSGTASSPARSSRRASTTWSPGSAPGTARPVTRSWTATRSRPPTSAAGSP